MKFDAERYKRELKEEAIKRQIANDILKKDVIGTFIPIDSVQSNEVCSACMGYQGYVDIAYPEYACAVLGYELVKVHKKIYSCDKPFSSDSHIYLLGWDCEVVKL